MSLKEKNKGSFFKYLSSLLTPKHLVFLASGGFISTGQEHKPVNDTIYAHITDWAVCNYYSSAFGLKNFYWNMESKWVYLNLSTLEESLGRVLSWYILEIFYVLLFVFILFKICLEKKGNNFQRHVNAVSFSLGSTIIAFFGLSTLSWYFSKFKDYGFIVYGSPTESHEWLSGIKTVRFPKMPSDFDIKYAGSLLQFSGSFVIDYYTLMLKMFLLFCSFVLFYCLTLFLYINLYFVEKGSSFLTNSNISFLRNFLLISSITQFFLLNLISSYDLLSFFVSLEGTTLCLYILSGLRTDNKLSIEAGLKYFLVSAVFSCIFGLSSFLIYLLTGSTNFYNIRESIGLIVQDSSLYSTNLVILLTISIFMTVIVFLMKLGAVPYHFWIGDVYQGSPLIVTIFFATIVRIAFFAIFFRLIMFVFFFMSYSVVFSDILFIFAFLSIFFGGIVSLAQTELKRFLAYSSIVHTGFILLGLSSMDYFGFKSTLIYLFIYIFTLLCFLLIIFMFPVFGTKFLERGKVYLYKNVKYFSDLKKFPIFIQIILIFFLFSMAGIPPLPGFLIKLYILKSSFFYIMGTVKFYSMLGTFSVSFYLMLLLFFIIILTSVLTSYNYIRLISLMSLDMVERDLSYYPQNFYNTIEDSPVRSVWKTLLYCILFILTSLNVVLIFYVGYLYNTDSSFFELLLDSIRHPFFNKELYVKQMKLDYEYIFPGPKDPNSFRSYYSPRHNDFYYIDLNIDPYEFLQDFYAYWWRVGRFGITEVRYDESIHHTTTFELLVAHEGKSYQINSYHTKGYNFKYLKESKELLKRVMPKVQNEAYLKNIVLEAKAFKKFYRKG